MTMKTTTTIKRTVTVTLEWEAVEEALRKAAGAPDTASVDVDRYDDATVSWTETEYDNSESSK